MTSADPPRQASGDNGVIARHVIVSGKVQGVFFRAATRRTAHRLDVVGWVRNRHDGRVEAHVQGRADDVDALLAWMRDGPPAASVEELVVDDAEPMDGSGFEIRR